MIDIEFEEGCTQPTIELVLPKTMEGTEGTRTLIELANIFEHALLLAHNKNVHYGDAWRRQGWMGNLARLMSKMARLKHMLWRDHDLVSADEPVSDTAYDTINIAAFLIINRSDMNKWGSQ